MTGTNRIEQLMGIMAMSGFPHSSGMRVINFLGPADGEEIIARAEAMQVGGTIGVAKVEVISKDNGAERICAFATATMRAVDIPAQMVDPSRR